MHDQFDDIEAEYYVQQNMRQQAARSQVDMEPRERVEHRQPEIPLYDISLAQAPAEPAGESFISRRYAGIPVWGWGLGLTALAAGGFYLYKSGALKPNEGEKDDDDDKDRSSAPALPADTDAGKWRPSRSAFGDNLERWMSKRGIKDVTVYRDADDAKKALKHVSPLVTMKCSTAVTVPLADLQKFCAREGLMATDHGDGCVGFYPADSGKRAKAWEKYIDDLRDEGQEI